MQNPKSETVTVTPEMAENWLNHSLYERQRRRAEWHVNRLAIEMKKGRFMPGTQIHFGVLNGMNKLVNGQHTLAAIVRSRIPIDLSILYTPVQSEDDLGHLYGRHDRHRGRTPHDAFLGLGMADKLELAEQEVNALGTALRYILNDFRRPSVHTNVEVATSVDFVAEAMDEWMIPARYYFECIREARHGMKGAFRRGPVASVGLVTMRYQEERAREFWGGAAQDDALHRLDPRRALNAFLLANSSGRGDPVTYIRNIATAWNKFYDDGTLHFLRPSDVGKIGVTIKGTPYKSTKKRRSFVTNDQQEPDEDEAMPTRQGILSDVQLQP
jgi:hypothetical protein